MPSDSYSVIPFQVLPNPGICRTCGSNQRDCVDFGITFDYEGAVLICVSCIQELTKIEELGFVRKDDVNTLYEANADLMLQMAALTLTRQELRSGLVAVLDTYDRTVGDVTRDRVSVPENAPTDSKKLF